VAGTPGILVETGSTAIASSGTLDEIELYDNSFVRLADMTPSSDFVEAGSTLTDYGTSTVHSDIQIDELAPLTSPFNITLTGEPFGLWGLWLTFGGMTWTDFAGLRWEMPALIDFTFSVQLITLAFDGSGTISFNVMLPAEGVLIGFPIEWQLLVVHPSTLKRRWSNVTAVISTP